MAFLCLRPSTLKILPLAFALLEFAPTEVASQGASQATRLRITNGCNQEALWVAHEEATGVGPDPQNVKIEPLGSYDFKVYDGLTGTRYWAKMRCNAQGDECEIGESGGPNEVCNAKAGGCAPPVDTKFEASFGQNGIDWVDISLVDGWTLPFKFEMKGGCAAGFGNKTATKVIDCSRLSFDLCPSSEKLGEAGADVDLRLVHPESNQVVGCYSPCSKLTLSQWANKAADGHSPQEASVAPYCCPTPPESPEACRNGPVEDTAYVRAVHEGCPGVYGYAYDDGMGLLQCPSDTRYEVTFFCPASSPSSASSPSGPAPSVTLVPPPAATPTLKAADDSPAVYKLAYEDVSCDDDGAVVFDNCCPGGHGVTAGFDTQEKCEAKCNEHANCNFVLWGYNPSGYYRCAGFKTCDKRSTYGDGDPNVFSKMHPSAVVPPPPQPPSPPPPPVTTPPAPSGEESPAARGEGAPLSPKGPQVPLILVPMSEDSVADVPLFDSQGRPPGRTGCGIELDQDSWHGTGHVASNGLSLSLEPGQYMETTHILMRPVSVRAEIKAFANGPACISMHLFANDHGETSPYGVELGSGGGGGGQLLRTFPGAYEEQIVDIGDSWHSVRIDAASDGKVRFYLDSVEKHYEIDSSRQSGTLQFVAKCTGMHIRNVQLQDPNGGRCVGPSSLMSSRLRPGELRPLLTATAAALVPPKPAPVGPSGYELNIPVLFQGHAASTIILPVQPSQCPARQAHFAADVMPTGMGPRWLFSYYGSRHDDGFSVGIKKGLLYCSFMSTMVEGGHVPNGERSLINADWDGQKFTCTVNGRVVGSTTARGPLPCHDHVWIGGLHIDGGQSWFSGLMRNITFNMSATRPTPNTPRVSENPFQRFLHMFLGRNDAAASSHFSQTRRPQAAPAALGALSAAAALAAAVAALARIRRPAPAAQRRCPPGPPEECGAWPASLARRLLRLPSSAAYRDRVPATPPPKDVESHRLEAGCTSGF